MEVKFPEQENHFPKTLAIAIVCCIAALGVGLFLGNGLGALFGTDQSVVDTSTYTDRFTAIRSVFTDADQLDSYSRTALALQDMDGLKILAKERRDGCRAWWNGTWQDTQTLFDEEIQKSLLEMLHTEDALYGVEDAAGHPITDVYLRNIAVMDGVVYYYLYYDASGFAGLAYDSTHETLNGTANAMPLTKTEDGTYEWFIIYDMGD